MSRTFTSQDLVALPNLDAEDAVALASALEAAAHHAHAAPAHGAAKSKAKSKSAKDALPPSIANALAAVLRQREALQTTMTAAPPKAPSVRDADRAEDTAVGALYDALAGWARLAGKIPLGDVAQGVREKLFADGIGFVHDKPLREWATVEAKLASLDEKTTASIHKLGLSPMLDHLRAVHVEYGVAVGATKARPLVELPQLREKRDALCERIRTYVVKVAASVEEEQPETKATADGLLRPLVEWRTKTRAKAPSAPPADATPPAAAPAPTGASDPAKKG